VKPLTAVDLFSGAGGLTEGFRQQGFEMLLALDNWGLALKSHRLNHSATEILEKDVLEVEPTEIPDADVLIGSPPCTQFSFANRGGGGDIALGMRFVLRFLRLVVEKRPRFWVMENVPRLIETLPERVPLRRLGLDEPGHLEIPRRLVLNSADFGVPQKRLRLFSGKFPEPLPTHAAPGSLDTLSGRANWLTARSVVDTLPDPVAPVPVGSLVRDPVYPELCITAEELTNHYMDTRLSSTEVEICRRSKEDHSWYGRMSFPDDLDRPARTVMATQSGVSRETFVIEGSAGGKTYFRRPTVREAACFQAFPITYQFLGRTAESRLRQIGNAVPPPLARGVARAIWRSTRRADPPLRTMATIPVPVEEPLPPRRMLDGGARRYPPERRFRDHFPGSRAQGSRVDLDNLGRAPAPHPLVDSAHPVEWVARLYLGSGKRFVVVVASFERAVEALAGVVSKKELRSFLATSIRLLRKDAPDATSLQALWSHKVASTRFGPVRLLRDVTTAVDRAFPTARWAGRRLQLLEDGPSGPVSHSVPVRAAAFLAAGSLCARFVNEGWEWAESNRPLADRALAVRAIPRREPLRAFSPEVLVATAIEEAYRNVPQRASPDLEVFDG
jgi:DNA (cytosine-5)-methyltransferase 1